MRHPLRAWAASATEILDDPGADTREVIASLHDLARINRAFGNIAALTARIGELLQDVPAGSTVSVLDIGTGIGDIPRALARAWARRGLTFELFGIERLAAAARETLRLGDVRAVVADGGRLPFRPRAFDLVLCTKVLHHLPGEPGRRLLAEMDRVARRGVVVADLKRSIVAAAAFWLASFPMRFQKATRHDGVISVFRGFSEGELRRACEAVGVAPVTRRHPGWCLTAAWRKNGA